MKTNENGLFPVLERILKNSNVPLGSAEIAEMAEIKAMDPVPAPNRISDYLGGLWRKGLALRSVATGETIGHSRFLYTWKAGKETTAEHVEYTPRIIADRPTMLITEDGNAVTIELANLLITIRQKAPTVPMRPQLVR
jgi:hypothetical protein